MPAYYNENDKKTAAWLRELIKQGLIADGEVDERSIEDVQSEDVKGFTQCHWFAGIGGWSYALRNAGWGDSRPVWTGSCPCPPFSSAGAKKACPQCSGTNPVPHVGRTGYFVCCLCDHEWFADARHLWPEMWRLISLCRPDTFFGEQVAGGDGRTWLASVRASLEILGYAVGAKDLCSAGFGSSDIRQRLYFVADSQRKQLRAGRSGSIGVAAAGMQRENGQRQRVRDDVGERGQVGLVGKPDGAGSFAGREASPTMGHRSPAIAASGPSRMADAQDANGGRTGDAGNGRRGTPEAGGSSELGDTNERGLAESSNGGLQRSRRFMQPTENPLAGFWANAEWIYCRDEKWRAVEPKYGWMVNGVPGTMEPVRGQGVRIHEETEEEIDVPPTKNRAGKVLRELSDATTSQAFQRQTGGLSGISAPEVLRSSLHGPSDGREDQESDRPQQQTAGIEDGKAAVRDVRALRHSSDSSPQGRESAEQRDWQFADFVRLLPSSYALAQLSGDTATENHLFALLRTCGAERLVQYTSLSTEEARRSLGKEVENRLRVGFESGRWMRTCEFPLAHGVSNRVVKLRGYGNAINPEVARAFIAAYMETRKCQEG